MTKLINGIEGFTLGVVQYAIENCLPEVLKDKKFYITEVFISNVELNQTSIFEDKMKGNFKAFKTKVHFTTLYEPHFNRSGSVISTPSIEGEILFQKINMADFAYWLPRVANLEVKNYLGVYGFKHFSYSYFTKIPRGFIYNPCRNGKKNFEEFIQKFSKIAIPLEISIFQET